MKRTVELAGDQIERLQAFSAHEGRPVDEIVAEAVAEFLAARQSQDAGIAANDGSFEVGFERWTGAEELAPPTWDGMDGLEYQRLVRSE